MYNLKIINKEIKMRREAFVEEVSKYCNKELPIGMWNLKIFDTNKSNCVYEALFTGGDFKISTKDIVKMDIIIGNDNFLFEAVLL